MATSPIYNWPEPDNTDLVKNGALAIRTLGNAIDTTMGTMTPKSTYTAKGSIAAATAGSTPANLSVGNNGEGLYADSSASTGLRYVATPSASNPVINAGFNVWQRGTSVAVAASTTVYTADRWNMQAGANQAMTISRQVTGDTTNLPFIQYCARVQRNSGQTGTGAMGFANSFETVNSQPFAGKTVNVSFYARKGADYSPTSSVLQVNLYSGTGTDQSINTAGYTGVSAVIQENKTLTTTWQRFTTTAQTVSSSATELALQFAFTPSGTASTNDYFEVTGVQLDIGSVALPFRTAGVSYQQELALCQRYYETSYNYTQAAGTNLGSTTPSDWAMSVAQMTVGGTAGIQRSRSVPQPYAVNKRIVPTIRFWDGGGNLSKYTAADVNGGFVSNNNSLDAFGGPASLNNKNFSWQTVAASATHAYCAIFWEASAEL